MSPIVASSEFQMVTHPVKTISHIVALAHNFGHFDAEGGNNLLVLNAGEFYHFYAVKREGSGREFGNPPSYFGKFRVQILARKPVKLTKGFCGLPQSVQTNAGIILCTVPGLLPSTSY
jgi:hypothetical protein